MQLSLFLSFSPLSLSSSERMGGDPHRSSTPYDIHLNHIGGGEGTDKID